MEQFITPGFWTAFAAIAVINLVLSGDNAIVIALAARNLPRAHQRLAIVWGTLGAVVVRVLLTLTVVWVLRLPGLMLAGGALLAWIAYQLLTGDGAAGKPKVASAASFAGAIRTIVVADAVMGLDNVLGVAGAARGSVLLIVLGLATSIPIVVWGSTLILKWIERLPGLLYAGGAVLAWTAATMLLEEPFVAQSFSHHPAAAIGTYAVVVGGVLGLAWLRNRRPALQSQWR